MMIAGRALGGKILDAWSKEKIILTFTLTSMVAMVILSFSRTLPMFIFVGLLWGTGVAFIFPVSMAYALDYAGSSGGTAVGTFRALMDLGMALGPMIMGLIIPITGYPDNVSLSGPYMSHQPVLFSVLCKEKTSYGSVGAKIKKRHVWYWQKRR